MGVQIADHWFERKRIDSDITFLWEPHVDPFVRCNIWHVRGRDRDLLVDTGLGVASLREAARDLFERPLVAVATHSHFDHIGGLYEFDVRVVHREERNGIEQFAPLAKLRAADFPEDVLQHLVDAGYAVSDEVLSALPHPGFNPAAYAVTPTEPTWLVDEGDVIDVGNRAFEVLHLPGHSPGSIGLWDGASGTLFSGDAVYDGPLLDRLPYSDCVTYARTMERLRDLPVTVVHAGHEPSFGRARLVEICEQYLRAAGAERASGNAPR